MWKILNIYNYILKLHLIFKLNSLIKFNMKYPVSSVGRAQDS